MIRKIKEFVALTDLAGIIVKSGANWETKYGLIFSDDISEKIYNLGIKVEWCDPDMDYKDDVLAYYNAIEEKAVELRKILLAFEERGDL